MYFKALTAIAVFSITTGASFAQDETGNQAPELTLADVQHLAEVITGDKSKILAYCGLGGIHDQLRQALDNQDAKTIDALVAKADAMEQQLGPEYDKVIEGLELIDLSSAEGQEIAEVFRDFNLLDNFTSQRQRRQNRRSVQDRA
jgi:hypothetical protein